MWNEKYFNPKPKPVQTSLPRPQKPKLKGFGDYDKNLINKFYQST